MRQKLNNKNPALVVLLTGLIALCLSALPILFLQLDDILLFSKVHPRTYEKNDIEVSGDDIYLARALTNQRKLQIEANNRYSFNEISNNFYVSSQLNPENMTLLWGEQGSAFFAQQVEIFIQNKILPQDYGNMVKNALAEPKVECYYSTDTAGFLYFYAYASKEEFQMQNSFCSFTLESRTGKIVTLRAKTLWSQKEDSPDLSIAQNYITYLELDALSDWKQPKNTPFAESAFYSADAQLLVYCTHEFKKENDMQSFAYSVVPLEEKQLDFWKSYMQSSAGYSTETFKD